eukprot:scaffold3811_cov116-Isochrysis_galbana.AAC.5
MLAIIARQVTRIRAKSFSLTRPVSRAWFSPLSMRCLRPCTPPVRLFSLLGLFTSCTTFDSTSLKPNLAPSATRPSLDSAGTRRPVWSVSSTEAPGVRSPSDTVIDEEFSSSQSKVFKSNESAELPPRDNLLFTAASQVLGHGTGVGQFSVRDNYDMFMISPPPSPPGEEEEEEKKNL